MHYMPREKSNPKTMITITEGYWRFCATITRTRSNHSPPLQLIAPVVCGRLTARAAPYLRISCIVGHEYQAKKRCAPSHFYEAACQACQHRQRLTLSQQITLHKCHHAMQDLLLLHNMTRKLVLVSDLCYTAQGPRDASH
jgi:hypothetical protein